jgi:hypothetical protein
MNSEEILDKYIEQQKCSIHRDSKPALIAAMEEYGNYCFNLSRETCSNTLTPKYINFQHYKDSIN